MQNKQSQEIIKRLFIAVDTLKEKGIIRGRKTFCDKYDINRMNFATLEKNPSRDMFELSWFADICRDFDVNPFWLLSGYGQMFTSDSIRDIETSIREKLVMVENQRTETV